MFISKSNIIRGRTPSLLEGISSDLPTNITNPDFSVNYTASSSRVVFSFGNVGVIDYVAVCASGFAGGDVAVRNGESTINFDASLGRYDDAEREHVLMFNFASQNVTDLRIVVDSRSAALFPTVSFVAAGRYMQVPNGGETSGYRRNWLTRNYMQRTQTNSDAAPVTSLVKRMPLKGSLSLPNMLNNFTLGEWQDFLDFVVSEPFFICEQDSIVPYTADSGYTPQASYICYNAKFSAPTAHNATRALNNLKIDFECFNGL